MDPIEDLPDGWQVWNAEEGGRVVLAYRPDVFDADAFPPACLPTISVAPGRSPDARPDPRGRTGRWYVAFYLEPDVRLRSAEGSFEARPSALERAIAVAEAFVAGELDYRGAYHEPPAGYLDRLDELLRTA